jgi:hypothetical protein
MKVRNNKFFGRKTSKAESSSMHHRLEEKKFFDIQKSLWVRIGSFAEETNIVLWSERI